ncbi:amidase [Zwartia sp.]|uniref:amidase n=1 Tax=Zwartia sp. TaxID=2978004 RepID=UPI0027238651|nr:amidase [Zwartia sp.]MDO9023356.1 amidase [Zwartia sp.]
MTTTSSSNSKGSWDIVSMDATSLSRAIHRRALSCVEVMDAFLAQIDAQNPTVNAIVAMPERESLRAQASERDAQLARHQSMGPLHGFPQAPKDIAPVAGMVTTNGSPIFKGQVTTVDSAANGRVRAGGAIFVGRTNSPEFGLGAHTYNPVYGITRNAFDPSRTAGGSSGGAGVALALRMLPVADGSDMMGSLRTPAAFNNVFGFRPSPGCVPHGPGEEVFFQQFSVTGPMGRNIPDLAMLLAVQAGFDPRLPLSRRQDDPRLFTQPLERDLRGMRVGWLGDLNGHLPMDPELLAVTEHSLEHFKTIGCTVEAVQPTFDLEQLWNAWLTLRSFTFAGGNAHHYEASERRALLKPEAIWEIERGLKLSGPEVFAAAKIRTAWYQELRRLFETYDFLVMPTTQIFPFEAEQHWPKEVQGQKMDTYHRWMQSVIPATMAGLPALSAPAGFSQTGLPAGIQIIGPLQADLEVLQLGHAYDLASHYGRKLSPLLARG